MVYQVLCRALGGQNGEVDWSALAPEDWLLLGEMAQREEVAALLYRRWKDGGIPSAAPRSLLPGLAGAWLRNCAWSERLDAELHHKIMPALAGLNSSIVLLKGGALARNLYPHPGLRPMTDLDLLVNASDLPEAITQLEKAGYRPDRHSDLIPGESFLSHHTTLTSPESGIPVELHHRLVAGRKEDDSIDLAWFFSQAEPLMECSGRQFYAFNPAAQLLHLALHLMVQDGEGESNLLHFYDIHLLVEQWGHRIDWEDLAAVARRMELNYALLSALESCSTRFGTPVPPTLKQASAGGFRRLVEARRGARPNTNAGLYLRQLAGRSLRTQAGLLLRFIFPSPEFMRGRYRLKPAWLWPLSYPLRWATGLRQLAQMAVEYYSRRMD